MLKCPGLIARFEISAAPPGSSPSVAFRQRKIAHDEKYVPHHVTTTSITITGSGSLLIPPCVTADHQTYIRSSRLSVRTYSECPDTTAMICRNDAVAPTSSPIACSGMAFQRTRASTYPATSAPKPIGYSDGMPRTQCALLTAAATLMNAIPASANVSQSSHGTTELSRSSSKSDESNARRWKISSQFASRIPNRLTSPARRCHCPP